MDASVFAFAYDVVDESASTVLDAIRDRAGATEIAMAALYHAARDIFPHGRSARLRYLEPGATFFRPDPEHYRGLSIRPRPSALVASSTPLEDLVVEAGRRGMGVRAWTVYLHHDRIEADSAFAPRTAFGDAIRTAFCVSHPEVRAYARAITADLAGRGVRGILAEAAHFFPLEHGGAHERYLVPLGSRTRILFGLCFCEACLDRAREHGADAERVREWVAAMLDTALESGGDDPAGDVEREDLAALIDGELGAYLAAREDTVTTLAAELTTIAEGEGGQFTFVDPSGSAAGFATGNPVGPPSAENAWRFGIDPRAMSNAVHEIEILAYAADPGRVSLDLAAYRDTVGPGATLSVALRPTVPDSTDVDNLAAKVEAARAIGAQRVDFYHSGLMRHDALDRIMAATKIGAAA
jgi:hypothetical protein